jgi:hypothetical protein
MGNRRMGLGRMEKLMERLKRDIDLGGSSIRFKHKVEAITNAAVVTRTLRADESGTLFTITNTTVDNNITFTFPTMATALAGVWYDFCFLVDCDDGADVIFTTGASGTDIYGYVVTGAADNKNDDFDGLSKITVDGSAAQTVQGMRLTFMSDGTNWHLSGYNPVTIGTAMLVESASA